jgi:hypothetical protein
MKTIAALKQLRLGTTTDGLIASARFSGFSGVIGASIWCKQPQSQLSMHSPSARPTTANFTRANRGYEDCSSPGEGIA